jgi:hypothetical protein
MLQPCRIQRVTESEPICKRPYRNPLPHRNSGGGSDQNWRHIGRGSFPERQVVPQNISRRALSAGFAREQDDARGTEHRNKESTATVPSCRTMRYGAATDFRASSSVHGNLSCACYGALNTIRQLLQYDRLPFAAGSACYSNITFRSHGNLKFSNDQIESATRCVQTLSELTRYRIKGYCGRGIAVCEPVYIRKTFSCRYVACRPVQKLSAYRGMLLQNSFGIDQHKFSGPYVRRTNSDLRDYVILRAFIAGSKGRALWAI